VPTANARARERRPRTAFRCAHDLPSARANDTAAGKARNRRTEITVQPNIDEIVAVPED
jgi:hypothetical protein